MRCVSQPQQYFYDLEGRVLLVLSSSGFKWHMNRLCQMTTPDSGLQTSPRKAFNVTSPPPPKKKTFDAGIPCCDLHCFDLFWSVPSVAVYVQHLGERSFALLPFKNYVFPSVEK